jgi:hypothetical protein
MKVSTNIFFVSHDKISDNVIWIECITTYKISDVTFVDNEFIALYDSSKIAMKN